MSLRQVPLICSGHSRPVPDLAYSPITPDGFFLISACLDGKPQLRNGETGDWIGTFEGHKGAVWCARLNSAATQAVTGSADYTAKLWDALTGTELKSFAHNRIVKTADFSKDGKKIITGGQDKILRIFDLEKPDEAPQTFEGHSNSIKVAQWSANDTNTVLSGGADEAIRIWDLRTKAQVKSIPTKGAITSMDLSFDGKILTTTAGREITFWDAATMQVLKAFTLNIDLNTGALHPSGTGKFVAGGSDLHVHVYDYATGEEIEVHKGHHGPVHAIRFSPDGESYSSGSEDGTIRIWQNGVKPYGLWQPSGAEAQTPK
eukprot:TRINITY_DN1525_c0_g1_i1.p1 TRINITY_DN1525_c0_g1~~TRINITY_DN1525_c0_g1_i1.p1  ORF type:complete len:317 (+),score=78.63 TRINITY_DN1525_c0_g1_i1:210-1160(+)